MRFLLSIQRNWDYKLYVGWFSTNGKMPVSLTGPVIQAIGRPKHVDSSRPNTFCVETGENQSSARIGWNHLPGNISPAIPE